ncbi:hypothetical protein EV213_102290 [Aureibacillus halotolerans]|uniref:Uncharacterized protein n=1 Tax=Aureibacillus halotolerans TaxID=1508390 RepID=A0A4R6UBC0_9BACI|nr:hypothetical protein EV213_102290 [Aureibacillus halotolerans]
MLSEEAEAVPGGKVNTMRYSRIDVDLIPFRVQAKYFEEAVVISFHSTGTSATSTREDLVVVSLPQESR